MKIKNRNTLLESGIVESRKIVLDVLEETLCNIDSYNILKKMISFDGENLTIGNRTWDLSKKNNIYVIGAGKASNAMVKALDEILGDKITDGVVSVKIAEPEDQYKKIRLFVGGHPLANKGSLNAAKEALALADLATKDDLYIGVMSGGCSALLSCPREGITLEDEITTRNIMLKSGANVVEVNSVCRHISSINGGYLAKRIEAGGAEIITIVIMDALGFHATTNPGEPVVFGFTPMAHDETTLQNAIDAIRKYDVADKLPINVLNFYNKCTEDDETPKALKRWTGYIINTLPDCSNLAKEAAQKRGINCVVLTNSLAGEAKEAGTVLASIAEEIQASGQPFKAPCLIVATGEVSTKIDVNSETGLGGPGQELSASFAIAAKNIPGVCIASIDTEGTDGPTDAAGGITDSDTFALSKKLGVDIYDSLRTHSVYDALSKLNCKIITGNTGTNLCDLHIMYVPSKCK